MLKHFDDPEAIRKSHELICKIRILKSRISTIAHALTSGRALAVPDYHRWALMYAKRKRTATLQLASMLAPGSRKRAIDDLRWICERMPMVSVATLWSVRCSDLRSWMRNGPPAERYTMLASLRAGMEKRSGEVKKPRPRRMIVKPTGAE